VTVDELFFTNVSEPARFREAIGRFDQLNAMDPNQEIDDGAPRPRELVNAGRLSRWVMTLEPKASEELRLASRCQHLCRWMIPRSNYPMTRAGYHQWRNELKRFHAGKSGEVLRAVGYSDDVARRVQDLNLKKDFPGDPESRVLEDALCLVFLQFQLADLAAKTDEDKVINALQRSWKKMTEHAHRFALAHDYGPRERRLLERALQLEAEAGT
jgi:hypothetical protein